MVYPWVQLRVVIVPMGPCFCYEKICLGLGLVVINGCMFLRIGGDYCFTTTPTSNNIDRFGEVILASSSSPVDFVFCCLGCLRLFVICFRGPLVVHFTLSRILYQRKYGPMFRHKQRTRFEYFIISSLSNIINIKRILTQSSIFRPLDQSFRHSLILFRCDIWRSTVRYFLDVIH